MSTTPEHANLIAVILVLAAFVLAAHLIIRGAKYLFATRGSTQKHDELQQQRREQGKTMLGTGLLLFGITAVTTFGAVMVRWDASGLNPTAYERAMRTIGEPMFIHITLAVVAAFALVTGIYLLGLAAINYSQLFTDELRARQARRDTAAPADSSVVEAAAGTDTETDTDTAAESQNLIYLSRMYSFSQLRRLTVAMILLMCSINLAVILAA